MIRQHEQVFILEYDVLLTFLSNLILLYDINKMIKIKDVIFTGFIYKNKISYRK